MRPYIDFATGKLLLLDPTDSQNGENEGVTTPFTHVQAVQSTVWTCNHGLHRKPASVRVLLNDIEECEGEVLDLGDDALQITFLSAIAGSAIMF